MADQVMTTVDRSLANYVVTEVLSHGVEVVGDHRGQVAKRIDIFAAALHSQLRVEEILEVDLSYTPPFGAPWDAVQVTAQNWLAG